jgi:hypothetical protein
MGAQDGCWKDDTEADCRTHFKCGAGVKQDSTGGNVGGFGEVFASIGGAYGNGKL